jgi:polyhydroxybutyrate depolymerase
MHGTSDPVVPYEGGAVYGFRGQGQGGAVLSVQSAARFWAQRNSCDLTPRLTEPQDTDRRDGTRIKREVFVGCRQDADVVVYTIVNGGHTWPGGSEILPQVIVGKTTHDINASEILWEFFSSKTLS